MALYLVVRHPLAPQAFQNVWENELLMSIQTTLEIGNLCSEAMAENHWVYIHRCGHCCGYEDYPPVICCSVHVANVAEIGGRIIVEFRDQTPLNIQPRTPPPPAEGQNSYEAPPPQ